MEGWSQADGGKAAAGWLAALASAQGLGMSLVPWEVGSTFPVPGAHWLQPAGEQMGLGAQS